MKKGAMGDGGASRRLYRPFFVALLNEEMNSRCDHHAHMIHHSGERLAHGA